MVRVQNCIFFWCNPGHLTLQQLWDKRAGGSSWAGAASEDAQGCPAAALLTKATMLCHFLVDYSKQFLPQCWSGINVNMALQKANWARCYPELKVSVSQELVTWYLGSWGTRMLINLAYYRGNCTVLTSGLRLQHCFMIRGREAFSLSKQVCTNVAFSQHGRN